MSARDDAIPYLVCYDISEPRRLRRVHRLLKTQGVALQYSVFYARLRPGELVDLELTLDETIHPGEDDVRIYPIPPHPDAEWLGQAPLAEGIWVADACLAALVATFEPVAKRAKGEPSEKTVAGH